MHPTLIISALLFFPSVVILTPIVLRSLERRRMLDVVMSSSERGQAVPADLITALLEATRPKPMAPQPNRDRRRGVILLAIAVGFLLIGLTVHLIVSPDDRDAASGSGIAVAGIAILPGIIGAAYRLLARMGRSDS